MKRLLIVESPTKAKTIGRMLGKDYEIMASMGHVRDLPEHSFGVDIEHDFSPQYVDTPRSRKIVKELKAAAGRADEIYLAPDPDREGEAIAWHLEQVLKKGAGKPFHRVSFHEITRDAIERALRECGRINMNLVDSQQARRVLDRLVGYMVSPLLWSRLEKGISAGRVQSVALRLIVEREREIAAFKPEEYWTFELVFRTADGSEFSCKLAKIDGGNFVIPNEQEATALLDSVLNGSAPTVAAAERTEKKRYAPPPFTTSTLQQAANNLLRFSATNTMRYAQQLYEGMDIGAGGTVGLITYMRTDSVTIAREAQQAAAEFIREKYGAEFVPDKPNFFKNKAAAQEAHEAIRPTDIRRTPEAMAPYLDEPQLKLYTLIWKRFAASQMTPCLLNQTSVDVAVRGRDRRDFTFRCTATVPAFPGFTVVGGESSRAAGAAAGAEILNRLAPGMELAIADAGKEQKFTEPPPHYTEATLIKELEENGIGRPSTYATILRTIQTRNYVMRDKGRLLPTELGYRVNDFLVGHLPELFDVGFTANMEEKLDRIEEGQVGWTAMLTDFYRQFLPWLEKARNSDAPPKEKAEALLHLLENVRYDAPEKIGRRTYDDGKFVASLREKFDKEQILSGKQYQALLALAAKYFEQLPSEQGELAGELKDAVGLLAEKQQKQKENTASAEIAQQYLKVFEAFGKVEWEAPRSSRGRTYDDRKFFKSLATQAASGKLLSDKQLAALARMAEKYRSSISNYDEVAAFLNSAAGGEVAGEGDGEGAAQAEEIVALLDALSKVTEWAEPVKRGRFTYDDKAFYASLAQQHAGGRKLSDKQLAALRKLAGKYASGAVSDAAAAQASDGGGDAASQAAEVAGLLDALGKVTEWAEPVKRGRFTYDDRAFFTSVSKRYNEGKPLTDKQLAALKKMVAKYASPSSPAE